MCSTITTERNTMPGRPTALKRFGYVIAIAVNAVMLYVVHQLLGWGWPRFLTDELSDVLPLITVSFVASIVANALFFWYDADWLKSLANVVTAAIGFVVAVRMFQVFPFDFSSYEVDWSWLVRLVIVVSAIGTAVGFLVSSVKVATAISRAK